MKKLKTALVIILLPLFAMGQPSSLVADLKKPAEGINVWWLGHDSWLIRAGELLIATDIYLDNKDRFEPAPISAEELAPFLDISFVTHAHNDHFNKYTSAILLKNSKCVFVMPESCLEVAQGLHIPEDRIRTARPREPFELQGIKVRPLRAIHGNANFAIYYEANLQDVGYVFDIGGTTFLQPGDTYLLEDHLFLKHVNVLFFSPTEHNMYIDPSVILINTLNPDFIFPQHHSTIKYDEANRFWAKGYPAEVKLRLSKAMQDTYYILKPGEGMRVR